jgi:hypothetical protein
LETSVYQRALAGNDLLSMFWLKCHKPQYRDRLNIDIQSVQSELEERLKSLGIEDQLLRLSFATVVPELRLLEAPKASDADSTMDDSV